LLRIEGFHRRDIVNRKKIALRAAFSRNKFFREAKMGADQDPPKLYVRIRQSVPLLCFSFYLDQLHDAPLMTFIVSRRLNTVLMFRTTQFHFPDVLMFSLVSFSIFARAIGSLSEPSEIDIDCYRFRTLFIHHYRS
jgi:hypothetical protein